MVERRHLAKDAGSAGGSTLQRITEHRQHHRQGTSLRRRGKRGAQEQAIGRSRGGRTTKIHAVANASGRLIAFDVTAGQTADIRAAPGLIEKLPKAAQVLADTAYDSDKFREFLIARGSTPVIKPNPTRIDDPIVRQGLVSGPQCDRARLLAFEIGAGSQRDTTSWPETTAPPSRSP
jgi:transposase